MAKLSDSSLQSAALVAVALVGVVLWAFANTYPQHFVTTTDTPPLALLAIFGLAVIAGMGLILFVLTRLGLELSKSVMLAVFGFNAAIIAVKFVLSPLGLYLSNATSPFVEGGASFGSVISNSQSGFTAAAISSGVAYIVALSLIYFVTKPSRAKPAVGNKPKIGWIAIGLVVLALALCWQAIVIPLIFLVAPLGDYLTKLGPNLAVILVMLGIGATMAIVAFKTAANEVNLLRRPMLIGTLLWLCISLILMYHVLWVVFMTALVTIWPFKTVIPPSSK
jgi:hypothetical protein